ncbi:MAG: response regulator [Myxococcota bacterium]|jgi:response regulator RpfG family c-di-GMP phosphodiesterase|nr:response regulator [Myxococcota bacterium]
MPSVSGDKTRVLIVDDEELIREYLADLLEFEGYYVEAVGSGEAALGRLQKEPFDIILSDLKMPGMGGVELLRRTYELRQDHKVVIMTGFGTVETATDAMKDGAFDYILKPFKAEELVRILERAIEQIRLERDNVALREMVGFYELSEALSSAMPLAEQLKHIAELVRENFHADGVGLFTRDESSPLEMIERAASGRNKLHLNFEKVMHSFEHDGLVLAHADKVGQWVADSNRAERRVESLIAVPLRQQGKTFGFLSAYSLKDSQRFTEGHRKGLTVFGSRAASAIETHRMYGTLKDSFTQTMEGFARALEAKDSYTSGHSDRVSIYSRLIAQTMGLPAPMVDMVEHGGKLHDIGKIGISTSELNKPQKLSDAEYRMFKTHPVQGKRIIEPINFLRYIVPCIYHHHESYNGKGYPAGLGGNDIPVEARILTVADAYDAMTSDRAYRKALPHEVAVVELKRCVRKQFDPDCVEAFLAGIDDFRVQRKEEGLPIPF